MAGIVSYMLRVYSQALKGHFFLLTPVNPFSLTLYNLRQKDLLICLFISTPILQRRLPLLPFLNQLLNSLDPRVRIKGRSIKQIGLHELTGVLGRLYIARVLEIKRDILVAESGVVKSAVAEEVVQGLVHLIGFLG